MRQYVGVLLLLLGLLMPLTAQEHTADQPPASPPPTESAGPSAFTPEAIPEAANATARELTRMRSSLQNGQALDEETRQLPEILHEAESLEREITRKGPQHVHLLQLRQWYETARQLLHRLDLYTQTLNRQIETYNEILQQLDRLETKWRLSARNAAEREAPEAIVQRAKETLRQIAALKQKAKKIYDTALTFADTVSVQRQRLERTDTTLEETLAKRGTELFTLDHPSLPEALEKRGLHPESYIAELAGSARYILTQARLFYLTNRANLYAHLGATLLLALLIVMLHLRHRRGQLFPENEKALESARQFIQHPVAATLLISILILPLFYPERPVAVGQFNALVAVGALIPILRESVAQNMRPYLYLLAFLFLLTALQSHVVHAQNTVRLVWLAMGTVMLVASVRILRKEGPLRTSARTEMRFFLRFAPLVPAILSVALIANFVGAVNLSVKLLSALITSLILFIVFWMTARIFRGLIVLFVRRRTLDARHMLQAHALRIQSYLIFLVNLILMGYWALLVLRQFDALYYVEKWWHTLMAISWPVGEVVISVGAIVDFLLVLAATWFLTRTVTTLLDLELFSRYRFPRGVPAAIKMIVRYLIITVGVVFALTVLGIKLTDLSLIAGALGVGIGFGLRHIMANFVSGLLLIFERPVQQGDVVEVGNVFGDVENIGVRATTIKTYDGSEVIVPNADFITKEVTNWTLSSKSRRIRMNFKVAFDNDPREVIAIIRQAIDRHPAVREEPAPKVLFDGYGDYYLEFTVYIWVDEKLLDVKSETALLIYEALTDAGVRMPVPFSRVTTENGKTEET